MNCDYTERYQQIEKNKNDNMLSLNAGMPTLTQECQRVLNRIFVLYNTYS